MPGSPVVIPDLVTLEQARAHLRLGTVPPLGYDDVADKLLQATAVVWSYLTRPDDDWQAEMAAWTLDTVPREVQAAILLQLGELYRFRGDDEVNIAPHREHGYLAPGVTALLHRLRDPACA